MHPADDYVAEFVAGISRLKIVRAHAVMRPVEAFLAEGGRVDADAPRCAGDEALGALIRRAVDDDSPIVIEEDGRAVGVVTRADILRTVVEGAELS